MDAERGLVLVDRNTVPTSLGDCDISVADGFRIPAKVEYVHPLHNMTIIRYACLP